MGKMLFLSSIRRWSHLVPLIPPPTTTVIFPAVSHRTLQRDVRRLFGRAQMHSVSIPHCCGASVFRVHWTLPASLNPCMFLRPFACMHNRPCAAYQAGAFFFNAILRVTFQKPWRAALLSVCGRLCDSVWVEKAQGHISGPTPIRELRVLQTILWWGESEGSSDEKEATRRKKRQQSRDNAGTSSPGLHMHKQSEVAHWQRIPLIAKCIITLSLGAAFGDLHIIGTLTPPGWNKWTTKT